METKVEKDYFRRLVELMERLRGPEGCPWDREQTRESLKPLLVEEVYEVLEALDENSPEGLCEELGDLLFQVIFHSQIAAEKGEFNVDDVCREVYQKMVDRHPHVFGDAQYGDAQEVLKHWEDIKAAQRASFSREASRHSLLGGISKKPPVLYATYQLSSKASRVGFDWPGLEDIRDQLLEEFEELREALGREDEERIREEVGDLLFTALNISRYLKVDPETALRRANAKFASRFRKMEVYFLSKGKTLEEVDLKAMESVWQAEKGQGGGS